MKPNFIFIGPDKSGSSWLYNIFKAHPEIFVPEIKDIYFLTDIMIEELIGIFLFLKLLPRNVKQLVNYLTIIYFLLKLQKE